ncbi:MAG: isoprenyl transferase [Clostridiaceae bacterium]|nr:isoprenyl transferase [Clostridiaceae bacterium]
MLLSGRFSMRKLKTNKGNLPLHIAIIPDGNGRWANRRGMPRSVGHREGSRVLRDVVLYCSEIGIKYVTVYAFSTENWKRPKSEVDSLMGLIYEFLEKAEEELSGSNIRIRVIGDLQALSGELQKEIPRVMELTRSNTGLVLNIALNYGGRSEIARAARIIAKDAIEGRTVIDDINEELISSKLYTSGIPDPDLLIRTAGEKRISNFLLWQCAYSEMWYTDVLWPDFSKKDLLKAIRSYQKRKRKFGGI